MTIEITNPELEAAIRQRMAQGAFSTPEQLLQEVLLHDEIDARSGADLVAALQTCPFPDVEIAPERVPSPLVRDAF